MIQGLTVLFLVLTLWYGVLSPLLQTLNEESIREEERELYLMKLKWIRKAYPELQDLSYSEISRNYHVTDAYNRISIPRGN